MVKPICLQPHLQNLHQVLCLMNHSLGLTEGGEIEGRSRFSILVVLIETFLTIRKSFLRWSSLQQRKQTFKAPRISIGHTKLSSKIYIDKFAGISFPRRSEIRTQASIWGTSLVVSSIRMVFPNGSNNCGKNFQRNGGTFLTKIHLGAERANTSLWMASRD